MLATILGGADRSVQLRFDTATQRWLVFPKRLGDVVLVRTVGGAALARRRVRRPLSLIGTKKLCVPVVSRHPGKCARGRRLGHLQGVCGLWFGAVVCCGVLAHGLKHSVGTYQLDTRLCISYKYFTFKIFNR